MIPRQYNLVDSHFKNFVEMFYWALNHGEKYSNLFQFENFSGIPDI
jgi:hypothetical protein